MIGGMEVETMPDRGWKRAFDEPIPLPRGRELVTLKDAGTYITKLPKTEHEAPEWQPATQALILVATKGGPATRRCRRLRYASGSAGVRSLALTYASSCPDQFALELGETIQNGQH
jgi:hypothetical protein